MTINVDKDADVITAQMLAEIPDTYQKNVGYPAWDWIRAVALGGFSYVYEILQYLYGLKDIRNFSYDDMVLWCKQRRNIIAKTETYSTGLITVLIGSGTITTGDLFETPTGLQFIATETKAVNQGDSFSAKCLSAGSVGNVPVNSINVIPVSIQGITSVSNNTVFSGGYDKEAKDDLYDRYIEDLQKPICSGNVYHYQKMAKSITGVGNAKIKPLWNGDNTVKIVIVDSNYSVADTNLIKSVQNYIDPYTLDNENNKVGWGCGNGEAPIGAYCTVVSADAKNIDITLNLKKKTGTDLNTIKSNIVDSINKYIKTTVFNDSYISYAQIGACILNAEGVEDYNTLKINNGTDNISLTDSNISTEIGFLNSLTITEF